jgi:ABC-type amino acid transport substrate-binding protein
LNRASVRIAVQDDDGVTDIAKSMFPKATLVSFPQMVDTKQRLIDVANGKADVTFDDAYYAQLFLDAHPGQLKRLPLAEPLQVFANTFMFDNDDWRMKVLLDTAITNFKTREPSRGWYKNIRVGKMPFCPF